MAYTLSPFYDDVARRAPAGLSERAGRDGLAAAIRRSAQTLQAWARRAEERRQLLDLDPRLLDDIGLTPAEALAEARKPFWKA